MGIVEEFSSSARYNGYGRLVLNGSVTRGLTWVYLSRQPVPTHP